MTHPLSTFQAQQPRTQQIPKRPAFYIECIENQVNTTTTIYTRNSRQIDRVKLQASFNLHSNFHSVGGQTTFVARFCTKTFSNFDSLSSASCSTVNCVGCFFTFHFITLYTQLVHHYQSRRTLTDLIFTECDHHTII